MAELEADTVVILSSELISKIVGEYFNRKMFKESVEIVDLKPTETGYMFSVAFVAANRVTAVTPKQEIAVNHFNGIVPSVSIGKQPRSGTGKFMKVEG